MNVKYVDFNGQRIVIDELGNIVSSMDRIKFDEILSTKKTVDQIKREIEIEEGKSFSLTKPQEVPKKNFFKVFLKNFLKMEVFFLTVSAIAILLCQYLMGPIPYNMSFMTFCVSSGLFTLLPAIFLANNTSSAEQKQYDLEVERYQMEMEVYQLGLEKEKRRNEILPQLKERLARKEEHLNQLVNEWEEKNKLTSVKTKLASDKEQLEELKRLVLQDISTFEYNVEEKNPVKVFK